MEIQKPIFVQKIFELTVQPVIVENKFTLTKTATYLYRGAQYKASLGTLLGGPSL